MKNNSERPLVADFAADVEQELRSRLPDTWRISVAREPRIAQRRRPDALITLVAPDGRRATVVVEAKRRIEPRDVPGVAEQVRQYGADAAMAVSGFLSPSTRRALRERGLGWMDLTGNLRLVLDSPPILIEREGAPRDPAPDDKPLRSLSGPAAAVAVRALLDYVPPYTLTSLARAVDLSIPSLYRTVELLEREAIVERDRTRGPVVRVDWSRLLQRWVQEYSVVGSNQVTQMLAPRGIGPFVELLRTTPDAPEYAFTGTLAAPQGSAVAPARLAIVYASAPGDLAQAAGLRPVDAGANVLVVRPFSPALMSRTRQQQGLVVVAVSQSAADLSTSPGRGPAEAESLVDWMSRNEPEWRQAV